MFLFQRRRNSVGTYVDAEKVYILWLIGSLVVMIFVGGRFLQLSLQAHVMYRLQIIVNIEIFVHEYIHQ